MNNEIKEALETIEKDFYFIGRLCISNPFKTVGSKIGINIEPLSEEPILLSELNVRFEQSKIYVALDEYQYNYMDRLYDGFDYTYNNKIECLKRKLTDKLIIFKPIYEYDEENDIVFKRASIDEFSYKDTGVINYSMIPVFNGSKDDFEENMHNDNPITVSGFYSDFYRAPEMIFCGKEILYIKPDGIKNEIISPCEEDVSSWKINRGNEILNVKYSLIPGYEESIINIAKSIYFVEDSFRNSIITKGESFTSEAKVYPTNKVFIDTLFNNTKLNNYIFSERDCQLLCTSINVDGFTFIKGRKGQGKRILAENFAYTMGCSYQGNSLIKVNCVNGYENAVNELKSLVTDEAKIVILDNIDNTETSKYTLMIESIKESGYFVFNEKIEISNNTIFIGIVNYSVNATSNLSKYGISLVTPSFISITKPLKETSDYSNIQTAELRELELIEMYQEVSSLFEAVKNLDAITLSGLNVLTIEQLIKANFFYECMKNFDKSVALDLTFAKYCLPGIVYLIQTKALDKKKVVERIKTILNGRASLSKFTKSNIILNSLQ